MGSGGRSPSVLLAVDGALPANPDDPAAEAGGSVRGKINPAYSVDV